MDAEELRRDFAVTLFGSHGDSLSSCIVREGILYSDNNVVRERFAWTSGGKSEVRIDDYDDIYFVAGDLPYWIWPYVGRGALIAPISRPAIRASLSAWSSTKLCALAMSIASASRTTNIHFVGVPFGSEELPFCRGLAASLRESGALRERLRDLQRLVADCAREIEGTLFKVVHPPGSCLDCFRIATRHEFLLGVVRLTEGFSELHPDNDFWHMNAKYGRELVRGLLLQQAAASGPREAKSEQNHVAIAFRAQSLAGDGFKMFELNGSSCCCLP